MTQGYVTATTFMVLTNVNKFAVIAFGIFVLGESRSWQAVTGCCVALGGGLWYARARGNLAEACPLPFHLLPNMSGAQA